MPKSVLEKVFLRLLSEASQPDVSSLAAYVESGPEPIAIIYDTAIALENLPVPGHRGIIWNRSDVFLMTKLIKGLIRIAPPPTGAPCAGAWQARYVAGPKLGKLLYGVGYAMSPSNNLMASREKGSGGDAKVTPDAQKGWAKAYASSRRKIRLDDIELPPENRMTPDDETDDCVLHDPRNTENPINYAYQAEGWEMSVYRSLLANHEQVLSKIDSESASLFIKTLERGTVAFWKNNYPE